MEAFRNFNEFVNRAGSRAKTLFSRVRNVYRGNNATTRIAMDYLDTLVGRGLVSEQGRSLAWALKPLRMIPIRQCDEIVVMDVLGAPPQRVDAMVNHFEASWGIPYPGDRPLAA
jgi:hypothetical protein